MRSQAQGRGWTACAPSRLPFLETRALAPGSRRSSSSSSSMAPSAWRHLGLATLLQLLFISCLPRGTVSWQAPFWAGLKERAAEFSLIWQKVLESWLQWQTFYFLAGTVTESFSSFDFQRNKWIPDHLYVSQSATYTHPLVSHVLIDIQEILHPKW